jgi:hypothetical protein
MVHQTNSSDSSSNNWEFVRLSFFLLFGDPEDLDVESSSEADMWNFQSSERFICESRVFLATNRSKYIQVIYMYAMNKRLTWNHCISSREQPSRDKN